MSCSRSLLALAGLLLALSPAQAFDRDLQAAALFQLHQRPAGDYQQLLERLAGDANEARSMPAEQGYPLLLQRTMELLEQTSDLPPGFRVVLQAGAAAAVSLEDAGMARAVLLFSNGSLVLDPDRYLAEGHALFRALTMNSLNRGRTNLLDREARFVTVLASLAELAEHSALLPGELHRQALVATVQGSLSAPSTPLYRLEVLHRGAMALARTTDDGRVAFLLAALQTSAVTWPETALGLARHFTDVGIGSAELPESDRAALAEARRAAADQMPDEALEVFRQAFASLVAAAS